MINLTDLMQDIVKALLATKDPAEKAAIIADHILSELPERVTFVAHQCIIFHWFDQSIVEALLKEFNLTQDEIRNVYEQLEALPFIEKVPWGLTFQDLTREGLLKHYGPQQPDLLKSAALQAALVYINHNDDKIIAEAAFCYVLAGNKLLGEPLIDKLTQQALERGDPQFVDNLQSLLDEAQQISFVRPSLLEIEIFISYDDNDEKLLEGLQEHLTVMQRQYHEQKHYKIKIWHTGRLIAGQDWKQEIEERLVKAHIILLLVSVKFLNSQLYRAIPIEPALQRHKAKEAYIIPVILRPCSWQHEPFGLLHPLPKYGKPVIKWKPREDAYVNIIMGIREAIDALF